MAPFFFLLLTFCRYKPCHVWAYGWHSCCDANSDQQIISMVLIVVIGRVTNWYYCCDMGSDWQIPLSKQSYCLLKHWLGRGYMIFAMHLTGLRLMVGNPLGEEGATLTTLVYLQAIKLSLGFRSRMSLIWTDHGRSWLFVNGISITNNNVPLVWYYCSLLIFCFSYCLQGRHHLQPQRL